MRIISLKNLRKFWENTPKYLDSKNQILEWHRFVSKTDWSTPSDVKTDFKSASILKDGRVVFNIAGNKYRLITWINYAKRIVYIKFIGTHKQYDKIDAQEIQNEQIRKKSK